MLRYTRADVGFGTLCFKFRQVQVPSRSPMVALPCCDALANSNDARRTRLDVPRRWLPSRNAVAHYVARIMTSSHECIAFSGRSRRFECRQRPKLGRICRLPPVVCPPVCLFRLVDSLFTVVHRLSRAIYLSSMVSLLLGKTAASMNSDPSLWTQVFNP